MAEEARAGQFGCDKPGHPQNYAHLCSDYDDELIVELEKLAAVMEDDTDD